MRTFHITWMMFFICFFGWFGLAPLMPSIRSEFRLSKEQVGNLLIASVSATILARLAVGRLCDQIGPRKTAIWLLLLGAIPVFLVGLSHSYHSFLFFRLAIGIIGASFVITQYHSGVMFASHLKGTANAISGGWGNLGGGVTNMVMPLIFASLVALGFRENQAWRYAMCVPGTLMLIMAYVYYRYTQDTPAGNFQDLRKKEEKKRTTDWRVLTDWRVWALTFAYAMCFGLEITFDNVAALHFVDTFGLSQSQAGFWAGLFGFMNLFARALGGLLADKTGKRYGMRGKGSLLGLMLLLEGMGVWLFAQAGQLTMALLAMLSFALFLKMANGVTYSIVPFINQKQVGFISGIVGAGGNLGGMCFGFLFKSSQISYTEAFSYIGCAILVIAFFLLFIPLSKRRMLDEHHQKNELSTHPSYLP